MVLQRAALAAILVVLMCSASILGATEKPEEKEEQKVDVTTEATEKTVTIPSKSVRTARRGQNTRTVVKEEQSKKATRSTAESNNNNLTPAATNVPQVAYAAATGVAPTNGFTSTADSPYAHLFHPSAIDLSGFFSPQFQNPGKQEQLDLASIFAQYNTGPAQFGPANTGAATGYIQQPNAGKQQSVYNYQQPGGQVFVSQPGHRQPNGGSIVYQSQKPANAHDYNLVLQTVRQNPKSKPLVFPTQKSPVLSNDYSAVYQAQRPNVNNLRKPIRKPVKLTPTYQSQRPPTPDDYASVYQKNPAAQNFGGGVPQANLGHLQYVQSPQQPLYVPQNNAYSGHANVQQGPVKVDVNAIVNSQVLPQIQQQGGQGIQLLDLSAFYPQEQSKGQPLFQVTGGKKLTPVNLNPSLHQHLQNTVPQLALNNRHQQSAPPAPTLSPDQLAAFYQSIGAQPPPPPSPSPASAAGHAPATSSSPAAVPTPAVYTGQAYNAYAPTGNHASAAGVAYQYPQQQGGVAAHADLSAYYNALGAAQNQAQSAAAQAQAHSSSQSVLPPELAVLYRQQQLQTQTVSQPGRAPGGSRPQAGGNVVYLSANQDPRDVYTYSVQPGVSHDGPAVSHDGPSQQPSYTPGQAAYYPQQYQGQSENRQGATNYQPPSNIANLISQLSAEDPSASPAYPVKPTVAASYLATTAAAAPKRQRPQQLKHVTAPLPFLTPTPNPTQPAMPQKTRQLVKKPHNFGSGYSFEITGR